MMVQQLPKQIEDNIFRIAQKLSVISVRHANANHLDVYLYQNSE